MMEADISKAQLEKFIEIAYRESGIRISPEKVNFLQNRLVRRMKDLGIKSFAEYYEKLNRPGSQEIPSFIEAITTNETFFFRCPKHFYILSKQVLPKLDEETVKIWSAAASTGAEPYSLAIALLERLPRASERKIKIFASDIDRNALRATFEGLYNQYALRLCRPEHIKKYFTPVSGGNHQILPQLRKILSLGRHNLQDPFPKGKVDIIFCRNVLIYFDEASKAKVIKNLFNALRTGGYLFLGESEVVPDVPGVRRIDASVAQKI